MTLPRAATAALTTLAVTAGALVGMVPAASAAAPTADLIAHYELDATTGATVVDSSGNSHDGTVVGTPTWTTGGLQLSGAASNANYVKLPDGLLAGKASATVSMQVKADAAANTADNFLWNFGGYSASSGTGTGNWFIAPRNALRTVVTPSHWSGEQSATWSGKVLTPGTWQNVTATIEPNGTSSTLKLYVDGALVATNANVTTSPATLTDHTRNRLGGSAYDGDRGFPGTIGETRIYGAALTAAQVADVVADDAADTAADILAGIDLGDTSAVVKDLALPTGNVAWSTSDAAVVTAGGVVSRPAQGQPDATATLTATATVAGRTATKPFTVTVKALASGEDAMPATADLRSYFPLNSSYPGTPAAGTTTFVGAVTSPVWTPTHLDVTGGGYVANSAAAGLSLTGSSTVSFDALIPSAAVGTVNSTLVTVGSNATTTNLSFHPFYSAGKGAAVIRIGGAVVATAQMDAALPRDVWMNLTVVLDDAADTLTVYRDGVQVAQATGVTTTASAIGSSVLRLNREGWGFTNLSAKYRDLRLYSAAATASNARALAAQNARFAFDQVVAAVNLPEAVVSDVTLPGAGAVEWTSSNPAVISTAGVVTQPAPGQDDETVTLTVSSTRGGLSLTHDFVVTVPAALSEAEKVALDAAALTVDGADDLRSIVTLTQAGAEHGSAITWATSDAAVVALVDEDGAVYADPQRAPYGHAAGTAELTATLTLGSASQDVTIDVTVPALPRKVDDEGYAFAYFTANTVSGENIYLAASDGNNALAWNELNDGTFVLTSEFGEKGLRDPFILRSHEGDKFFLIATDLSIGRNGDWGRAQQWGSQYIEIWESTDLVTWSQQRHVKVSPDTAGMTWAPEAYWDDELGEYVVFWASRVFTDATHSTCITTESGAGCYARMMYATTKDFVTFSAPKIWQDTGAARIDSTVIKDGDHFYRYTKDEGGQSGCTDIIAERSTSLTTVTTKASAQANTGWTNVANCLARTAGFNGAVEGPTVFAANPGDTSAYDYYLYLDNYGGSGYFPLGTNDLASGAWSIAQGQLPASRHGTVMPVTLDQWQVLTGADVETTSSTTTVAYDPRSRVASATVVAADGFEVGGTVTFTAGTWSQTVQLTAGTEATASATVPAGVAGALTVAFAGTAEIAPSTGSLTIEVPVPTGLVLTSVPRTSYRVGDAIDLAGLAGTVTYSDGTTVAVDAADVTVTGFSAATPGTRTVTVSFADAGRTVTATYTVTVTKAVSSVTLTRSVSAVPHGGKVTFTARVTGGTTGSVAFWSSGQKLGTATVVNGVATKTLRLTGVGTKLVTAVYSGTSTVASSSSSPVKVTVRKAKPTSIAVTSTTFTKGTRPTVVVKVGVLDNGSYPVGKVKITFGTSVRTVTLPASAKGVVRLTLPTARTTAIKVKAQFLPTDTADVTSVTSAWRTLSPR
ncbi:immunoglobulin-like domain-containing protein [Cellulomonas sp.]|uniref:immunoglobulin-like domain-containing protein n=1 Tax=Cellulomonas sp. TaxID=40001 RepID=UPI0025827B49|nr:immunoglobulin-like domain-containing protein [Cellulomonas sp.]MCR6689154.1 Ig-like domain repeat protein [Cellulomonas sp.]